MSGDAALVVIGLAIASFMGWSAYRDIGRGALSMNRLGGPVKRAESPGVFWFATGLSIAMAALSLAMSVSAVGKLAGWWEFLL